MVGILVFVVLGAAFGFGIGAIVGYTLGVRAGARKGVRGFPVSPGEPRFPGA